MTTSTPDCASDSFGSHPLQCEKPTAQLATVEAIFLLKGRVLVLPPLVISMAANCSEMFTNGINPPAKRRLLLKQQSGWIWTPWQASAVKNEAQIEIYRHCLENWNIYKSLFYFWRICHWNQDINCRVCGNYYLRFFSLTPLKCGNIKWTEKLHWQSSRCLKGVDSCWMTR